MGAAFPFGRARKTVDSKGRIQLPAAQATALGSTVYVCPGCQEFLEIYSESAWKQYQQKLILAMEKGPLRFRGLLRHILGSATQAKIDPQGRLVIPRDILDWANLSVGPDRETREVLVVGVGGCVEIWNPEFFMTHMKSIHHSLPDLWDEVRATYEKATVSRGRGDGDPSEEGVSAIFEDDEDR